MALSDAQIDRFSRQIILPEIGGAGQERLLRSSVAVAGEGDLAAIAAHYLAGAGVGRIELHRRDGTALALDLADLDPEIAVLISTRRLPASTCDVLVACDLPPAALVRAAAVGRPLVAGGAAGSGGWMVVAEPGGACVGCAARQAVAAGIDWRPSTTSARSGDTSVSGPNMVRPEPVDELLAHGAEALLAAPVVGVVGSLMALAVMQLVLGLGGPSERVWLQFDAAGSTLIRHPLAGAVDCPACAAGVARGPAGGRRAV